MKKQLSLILAALMLGAALASCGGAQTETPVDTQADTQETGTDTAADTEEIYDPFAGMPEKDYNGYEFTILTRNLDRWTEDMYVAEATGDIVNDAIFDRNSRIEEAYNIKIVSQRSSDSNSEMDAKTSILADDDAYDIVVPHGRAAFEYAAQGLVLDWNTELPYVNLDNPWWDQDARENFSINHKLYVMIGDISYCSMGAANVMLFNKQLFNQLDLEYPYQTVRDGKWTFEMFAAMVKDAGADLNGDGAIDIKDDRFGYLTQKWIGPVQAFATSGLRVFSKDENDIPYISFMSDKTVDVFNRYFDLLDLDAVYLDDSAVSYVEELFNTFREGRALFEDLNMFNISDMRSMDADFGIIPWPKYDEASEYCTNVDAGTNMIVIPITARDPERTSLVLEAMGNIGYHKVLPAYFEVAIQTKASRDTDSAEMLEIIKSARIFDLGYYSSSAAGKFNNEFVNFIDTPSLGRNISSFYEKNIKSAQKALDKMITFYTE